MLARTWRGWTSADQADAYLDYLSRTGLADYAATAGHLGTLTLRRIAEGRAEFLLVSLWRSPADVRRFAGGDGDRAVFYPEDERFLLRRERRVRHYDVAAADPAALVQALDARAAGISAP